MPGRYIDKEFIYTILVYMNSLSRVLAAVVSIVAVLATDFVLFRKPVLFSAHQISLILIYSWLSA